MKTKTVLLIGLVAVVGWAVASRIGFKRPAADEAARGTFVEQARSDAEERRKVPAAPVTLEASSAEEPTASIVTESENKPGSSPVAVEPRPPELSKAAMNATTSSKNGATAQPKQPSQKKEVADPIARVALSFVGADPEAEAYWIEAINDPSLSAHERSDLIEDLNEEGFFDPKHPTLDDLPLIVSRLQLIEELAPDAMDDVNLDAFAEARKDLEKMALVAQQ